MSKAPATPAPDTMQTIQHPFFLSSAQGSNRSADGSSFSVRLNPPLRIPREAMHTRVYCNQASCVYSFPNVTASDNAVHLSVNKSGVPTRYDLTVPPGLYGGLEDIQAALAHGDGGDWPGWYLRCHGRRCAGGSGVGHAGFQAATPLAGS